MKTNEIRVSSHGSGMKEALDTTEALGREVGLSKKEELRLRLLAEELFGMVKAITGEAEALYWAEREDKKFSLHLRVDTEMNKALRKQLLSVSSSGENAAAKGFMGKLLDVISTALSPKDEEAAALLNVGMMNLGATGSGAACVWSMQLYKTQMEAVLALPDAGKAREVWDELEKSIVAKLADEVSVYIRGGGAELVIDKAF